MADHPIRRVVIAGGGTAGWAVAMALAHNLRQIIDITLVESDEIGTVGVGESTIPTARRFHQIAGIDEKEFVAATDATFKLGIAFENWAHDGERYLHSFGVNGRSTWMADFQHVWLAGRNAGVADEIGTYCLEHQAALAERFAISSDIPLNYAYHLDSTAYGRYLRQRATGLGVTRVEGRIDDVVRDSESGDIAHLKLQSGAVIEGDLFIDCTGFRALLIEGALGTEFDDWSHWLRTDRAVVVQTEAVRPARPYTRAVAHQAGWRWEIPLQHRVGNGLVYCSAFLSDDAARDQLSDAVEGAPTTEPRLLRFRSGARKTVWNRNCIAIGLSAGFLEPLESTNIHVIMTAVTRLIQTFPFDGITGSRRRRYNDLSFRETEGIRDFLILHYHLNKRPEPFWRAVAGMDIPESLAERIRLFREGGEAYQDSDELFRVDSWVQVMLGQGVMPVRYHPLGTMMGAPKLSDALSAMSRNIDAAVAKLPSHQAFLDRFSMRDGARSD